MQAPIVFILITLFLQTYCQRCNENDTFTVQPSIYRFLDGGDQMDILYGQLMNIWMESQNYIEPST